MNFKDRVPVKSRVETKEKKIGIPPHAREAEQSVLGCLLLEQNSWDKIADCIEENDFYEPIHRIIFRAISELIDQKNRPIDILTVAEFLKDRNQLEQIGGDRYLFEIVNQTVTASNILAYAEIVRERSILRQLAQITTEIGEAVFNREGRDAHQLLDFAEQKIFQIAEQEKRGIGPESLRTVLERVLSNIHQAKSKNRSLLGLETGFYDLDKMTTGLQPAELIITAGRPSMGKAQPLDANIRLIDGWKKMGEIQIGDQLASVDGESSQVIGVFPQGIKDIYKITFSDGRSTEVCEQHLWQVYYRSWVSPRLLTTAQIIILLTRKRYQHRLWIDYCSGDFGHEQVLPIEPWLLGFLLGDGHLKGSSVRLATACTAIIEKLNCCLSENFALRAAGGYDYRIIQIDNHHRAGRWGVWPNLLKEKLKELDLWGMGSYSKFVPELYKTAHKTARLEILSGLLDSDGWVEKWGTIRFATTSKRLADDVIELVRSIGGWATQSKSARHPSYVYKNEKKTGQPAWVVNIHYANPQLLFTIPEKQSRVLKTYKRRKMAVIQSIEWIRKAAAQCIAVTHSKQLYITDNYIVTHNTAFALNIAEHVALKEKKPVLIFSMEMPAEQLVIRILAHQSRVNQQKLRTGDLTEDDWKRQVAPAFMKLSPIPALPLWIDDTPSLTPTELRARARRVARDCNELGLIIIDYLQLMQSGNPAENRAIEIAQISRALKALAKELNVPVIALSQLNRGLELRADKKPLMSDLRESGSLEQDADLILFIYRDEVYRENSPDKGKAKIIIAKHRNGPTGEVTLLFRKEFSAFENIAYDHYPDHEQ